MNSPISNFSFFPLSGKSPLEITFLNKSQNLGGTTEWDSCPLNNKYLYSALNNSKDLFYIDFTGISSINSTYNENGFILAYGPTTIDGESKWNPKDYIVHNGFKWIRIDKTYKPDPSIAKSYKGVWDSSRNLPKLGNNGEGGIKGDFYIVDNTGKVNYPGQYIEKYVEPISIDCSKNFSIEMTIEKFNNFHGTIELYFHQIKVDVYSVNPGIHINTIDENRDRGFIRGINNYGSTTPIEHIEFPARVKFEKQSDTLNLYINNKKIHSIAANLMGLNTGLRKLRLKVSTQNDIRDWVMHIKDIYIINDNMPSECKGHTAKFLWDFDDGVISEEINPKHIFTKNKVHKVKLTTITEFGSHTSTKNIFISGNDNAIDNADEIYQNKKSEFIKDISNIPNYCANEKLRQIINTAIYDAIRHADDIKDSITANIKVTVSKKNEEKRNIRCETSFDSGKYDRIEGSHIRRTYVQTERQQDIINGFFEFE